MSAIEARLFGLLATIWGGVLVYFYHSFRIKKYLAPDFHHLVLFGGIGIIILGLFHLWNPKEKMKESGCEHEHALGHHEQEHDRDCADCHHEHDGHGPVVTYALTLLPLVGALYLTQDKLSDYGIARKSSATKETLAKIAPPPPFTLEDLEKRVPRNAEGDFQLSIVTPNYIAGDREVEPIFEGLQVEFEGRLGDVPKSEGGSRKRIYQSIISCCAADMSIVGIPLEFTENLPAIENGEWVKTCGILTFETRDTDRYPLLKVRKIEVAEEPYSEFLLRQ
ncbi:MAG: hypothetical protein ACON5H_09200 [Akkermansiaceae bacterium]